MSEATLGVGIIGLSPVRGWAATAHIPALRALPNYEIRALGAHSAESARAVGEAFRVDAVFSDHEKLVIQPDIDVVAVTVKVPHHRELVSAAIGAGKAVYCEWPLGRDVHDARAMAALAGRAKGSYGRRVAGPPGTCDRVRQTTAQRRIRRRRPVHDHGRALDPRRRRGLAQCLRAAQAER